MRMIQTKILLIFVIAIITANSSYAQKTENEVWSEPVNGIQGRLLIRKGVEVNGTKMVHVYLELRNILDVATPIEVYFDPVRSIRSQMVDAAGKSVAQYPSPADIESPLPFFLALPFDSMLRFRISVSGYGVPRAAGTNIQLMGGNWLIRLDDKGEYFLEGTFVSQPTNPRPGQRVWQGTLKLPKVTIPH